MTVPQPIPRLVYQVANCRFEVRAENTEAQRIWDDLTCKQNVRRAATPFAGSHSGRIEIYNGTHITPPNLSGWTVEPVEDGCCWTNGSELWLEIADSHLRVTSTPAPRVQLWLGTSASARSEAALTAVTSYALTALLRRCGCYTLHAAGLQEPTRGQGVLLVGDSGSGKSTLAVRLAQNGWRYMSDDLIALTQHRNAIQAWGLRRDFSLTAETLRACLQSADELSHEKRWITPHRLFTGQGAANCQPTAIFFTKLSQATSVTPLAPSEAMLKLIRQCPWLCYDPAVAQDYTQVLLRLTQQCQAYQLLAGRDLLECPNRAHELLAAYLD